MIITDGRKTVRLSMSEWDDENPGYGPELADDLMESGSLPIVGEYQDDLVYGVEDVDYCVDYANDIKNGTGDSVEAGPQPNLTIEVEEIEDYVQQPVVVKFTGSIHLVGDPKDPSDHFELEGDDNGMAGIVECWDTGRPGHDEITYYIDDPSKEDWSREIDAALLDKGWTRVGAIEEEGDWLTVTAIRSSQVHDGLIDATLASDGSGAKALPVALFDHSGTATGHLFDLLTGSPLGWEPSHGYGEDYVPASFFVRDDSCDKGGEPVLTDITADDEDGFAAAVDGKLAECGLKIGGYYDSGSHLNAVAFRFDDGTPFDDCIHSEDFYRLEEA